MVAITDIIFGWRFEIRHFGELANPLQVLRVASQRNVDAARALAVQRNVFLAVAIRPCFNLRSQLANLGWLVLGCIEADACKQAFVLKIFSMVLTLSRGDLPVCFDLSFERTVRPWAYCWSGWSAPDIARRSKRLSV